MISDRSELFFSRLRYWFITPLGRYWPFAGHCVGIRWALAGLLVGSEGVPPGRWRGRAWPRASLFSCKSPRRCYQPRPITNHQSVYASLRRTSHQITSAAAS